MRIVRGRTEEGTVRSGVLTEQGLHPLPVDTDALLALPLAEARRLVEEAVGATPLAGAVALLAPVTGLTEVWAAGVTYERSREARMAESEREADIYDRVYDAQRPELFFKAAAWRVVGHGEPVSVRADSEIDVPEPELAVVANRHGEVLGYAICNDVSSRTIEGENPLYLPQAKAYLGACAVGPGITPAWLVPDPRDLAITMTIERGGAEVWSGDAHTSELHRGLDELVDYLFRADEFPRGVVLATGTSLVPELPFTLEEGDVVSIELAGLGVLTNPVVVGKQGVGRLVDALDAATPAATPAAVPTPATSGAPR